MNARVGVRISLACVLLLVPFCACRTRRSSSAQQPSAATSPSASSPAGTAPERRGEVQAAPTLSTGEGITNFTSLKKKLCIAHTPGAWWLGTSGGLARLNEKTFALERVYTPADGLAGTAVGSLVVRGRELWASSPEGISRLDIASGAVQASPLQDHGGTFELDEDRRHLWVLGGDSALCLDADTRRPVTFALGERVQSVVREGATLWAACSAAPARSLVRSPPRGMRLIRLDTTAGARTTRRLEGLDDAGPLRLFVGRDALWGLADSGWLRRGGRVLRVNKETLEAALQDGATGLPHDHVQQLLVSGGQAWVATIGAYDSSAHVGVGGKLCRYDAAAGRWETLPSISGSKQDEPTCLAELGGDLWVATRAYDETRRRVIGWAMVPIQGEAPLVKTLTLNRFLAREGKWQTFAVPAATDYDRVTAMALQGQRLWFLVERSPVPQVLQDLRQSRPSAGVVCGFLDVRSARPQAVVIHQASDEPRWNASWWPDQAPMRMLVVGDLVWLMQRNQLWRVANGSQIREVDPEGALPDPWVGRVFVVEGQVLASCGTRGGALLRLDPAPQRWAPWARHAGWMVTDVCRDPGGAWWLAAALMGNVLLPADSARNDEDRKPLLGGLCRSRDGAAWEAPSIAPWTWQHQDASGEVRFLAAADITRTAQDTGAVQQSAGMALAPGAPGRIAARVRYDEGISCVESDGKRVWAGALGEGVFCLEGNRWRRLWPKSPPPMAGSYGQEMRAPEHVVTSLALHEGSLWIATLAGLRRCRVGEVAGGDSPVEKIDNTAVGFRPDPRASPFSERHPVVAKACGRLWFSGGEQSAGAYRLDEAGRHWECSLPGVHALCFAGAGDILWMGLPDGLLRYNTRTGARRLFTVGDGLLSDRWIRSVAVDERSVWVGTGPGISRLDRTRFEADGG